LVLATVVVIVHLLGTPLGALLSLVSIPRILALGLSEAIDLAADEASEQLLGEAVGNGLTLAALVVLEHLHAFEGGSAGDEFVRELGTVFLWLGVIIDLGVGVTGFVCRKS
jgi:hypothetical protein